MIVCCCDGSVDGIFTAIYRAWEIGTSRTSISVTEGEDMELFSEYRFFETSTGRHGRRAFHGVALLQLRLPQLSEAGFLLRYFHRCTMLPYQELMTGAM